MIRSTCYIMLLGGCCPYCIDMGSFINTTFCAMILRRLTQNMTIDIFLINIFPII